MSMTFGQSQTFKISDYDVISLNISEFTTVYRIDKRLDTSPSLLYRLRYRFVLCRNKLHAIRNSV